MQPGDTIDFWRVEQAKENEYLLLRAEMRLPGTAWLEFRLENLEGGRTRVVQTAIYEPHGLAGLAYWHLFSLPHRFIFPGMLREIIRRSEDTEDHPD